jgi:predicted nucleic acid-binding protein
MLLEVLPFETPADTSYGLLRTRLEQAGTPIGANDLLTNDQQIAAHALTLGYVIVTDNEKEFSRVKRLRLQNWLRSMEVPAQAPSGRPAGIICPRLRARLAAALL